MIGIASRALIAVGNALARLERGKPAAATGPIPYATGGRFPSGDDCERRPFAVLIDATHSAVIAPVDGRSIEVVESDGKPVTVNPGEVAAVAKPFRWRLLGPASPEAGGNLRPRCPECGAKAGCRGHGGTP